MPAPATRSAAEWVMRESNALIANAVASADAVRPVVTADGIDCVASLRHTQRRRWTDA
jgi:hypothetical protein